MNLIENEYASDPKHKEFNDKFYAVYVEDLKVEPLVRVGEVFNFFQEHWKCSYEDVNIIYRKFMGFVGEQCKLCKDVVINHYGFGMYSVGKYLFVNSTRHSVETLIYRDYPQYVKDIKKLRQWFDKVEDEFMKLQPENSVYVFLGNKTQDIFGVPNNVVSKVYTKSMAVSLNNIVSITLDTSNDEAHIRLLKPDEFGSKVYECRVGIDYLEKLYGIKFEFSTRSNNTDGAGRYYEWSASPQFHAETIAQCKEEYDRLREFYDNNNMFVLNSYKERAGRKKN